MDAVALLTTVIAIGREQERASAALAPLFAPAFNAAALLAPGENALSATFGWMLDDRGNHGQGALFRTLFLEQLIPAAAKAVDWTRARVRCEVPTRDGGGRIDLLVEARGGGCLVIENKPWAGWQDRQLQRYLDDHGSGDTPVWVHALIGASDDAATELDRHWYHDGRQAEEVVASRPASVSASDYRQVVGWLDACALAARPDRVRTFLFDLVDYCRRTILQEPTMSAIHSTAALIVEGGRATLAAAEEVKASLAEVYRLHTSAVADRVGGQTIMVGAYPTLTFEQRGVRIGVSLIAPPDHHPWIGALEETHAVSLRGEVPWGRPERQWPKWVNIDRIDCPAAQAVLAGIDAVDVEMIAVHLRALAAVVIG